MRQNFINLPFLKLSLFWHPLKTKTLSIKHAYAAKTVLFLTCKRHYTNDVSCFKDSSFATYAQWRRPLSFFQNGLFDQAVKQETL